ncbi:hypothetical protein KFU94_35765 [Chloroflexi bacterium TSY]|nr:hypothetical protein [Chloroflexi bacterium TSY]
MIAQPFENSDHPDPIQERVGLGMFTDREQELASLMEWVEQVAQKYGRSIRMKPDYARCCKIFR